jgi:uncharacterized protein
VALMLKGLSPGAAFVFLTVGPATNFSFIVVIAQVMGKKIVAVYLTTLAVMSIIMGYALNAVFRIAGTQSLDNLLVQHFCRHTSVWQLVLSGIFLGILLLSFYRLLVPKIRKFFRKKGAGVGGKQLSTIKIKGMSCKNCSRKVTEAIRKVHGVESVEVDVEKGEAVVGGTASPEEVKNAVEGAGYEVP